jgi:hypothetical protein
MAAQVTAPKRETGPAATFSFSLYPRHIRYIKRRSRKRVIEQAEESFKPKRTKTGGV